MYMCIGVYVYMRICVYVYMCICVHMYMYLTAATGASNMEPIHAYMTDSTDNATPLKSTKSTNSNFTVQISIQTKSPFEFVP